MASSERSLYGSDTREVKSSGSSFFQNVTPHHPNAIIQTRDLQTLDESDFQTSSTTTTSLTGKRKGSPGAADDEIQGLRFKNEVEGPNNKTRRSGRIRK